MFVVRIKLVDASKVPIKMPEIEQALRKYLLNK